MPEFPQRSKMKMTMRMMLEAPSQTQHSTLQVCFCALFSVALIYQSRKFAEAEISGRNGRLNLKFIGSKVFVFLNFSFLLSVSSIRCLTLRRLRYLGTQQARLIGQNRCQLLQSRPQELAPLSVHGPSAGRTGGGGGGEGRGGVSPQHQNTHAS